MVFAARLRQLRNQTALTLNEIAERSGLKASYISKIESGEAIPSCQTLDMLAETLDVPVYQLFYDQEPPPTPWLTPRPTLEELAKSQFGLKPETRPEILKKVEAFCHKLSSLLR